MRRRLPGIDAEFSAAVGRVAAVYARCPKPRPDVCGERFHESEQTLEEILLDPDGAEELCASVNGEWIEVAA